MEASGETVGGFKDFILFLVTAAVIVPLFRRLRLSPILGFLAAGVALGPFGLATLAGDAPWLAAVTIGEPERVAALAELGVVFLLFTVGLGLSWDRIRAMYRLIFGLGAAQMLACGAVIAAGAVLLGQPVPAALLIGAALAMSSTAMVMPLLEASRRQHAPAGRAAFSVLLFQDMAVAPILVTMAILAGREGGLFPEVLLAFVPAALGLAAVILVSRFLLRPLLRVVARSRSDEAFVAATLLIVIGTGLAAAAAGLSMALGAFIAGLLLAETEYRRQVEVTVEPFKALLLGLFFLSVGGELDLSRLWSDPAGVLALAAAVIAVKAAIVFALARAFGLARRQSLEAALLLAAAGEFALVILTAAVADGLLADGLAQTVLVAATLSMFAVPFLAALGSRIAGQPGHDAVKPEEAPQTDEPAAVIVVGYGRVGRLVGEMLERHEVPWAGVDSSIRAVEEGRLAGHPVWFGDASRREFLERVGLARAVAVIVTLDDMEAAETIVTHARQARPKLAIVARARDAGHARRLYALGASDAVPETIDAALQLSAAALVGAGIPMGSVMSSISQRRDAFGRELRSEEEGPHPG